jgi:hypothetical protein
VIFSSSSFRIDAIGPHDFARVHWLDPE